MIIEEHRINCSIPFFVIFDTSRRFQILVNVISKQIITKNKICFGCKNHNKFRHLAAIGRTKVKG